MKHNKTLRRGLGILISLIMCLGLLPVTALAGESTDVEISEANFPDANFRNFVKDYDLDSNNSLSEEEIAKVTDMNCYGITAATLEGIEYFTALENLRCDANFIEELDLSKNINLKSLVCNYNPSLTKLNINNCTKLESVECTNCGLTSLDLSDNAALKSLACHSNNITELKNIKNTKLEYLGCSNNAITELNLDDVPTTLESLYCSNNKLTYLNLSNTGVSKCGCGGNSYTVTIDGNREFDLTKLPGGEFNVSQASNWAGGEPDGNILKVEENAIEVTYDYNCGNSITGSFTLKIIDPADDANGIEINEENFPDAVFRQYVLDNCDASGNGKLSKKEIADTKSIDFYISNIRNVSNLKGIENFTALEELNCWKNKLTSIDLSKNTELKTLNCGGNYLTVLDLSSNTKLENLYCFDNKLTSLDLSNTNITSSSKFEADGNCAEIILADNDERTFELSTLSGGKFDVNNVTDLEGGFISGTTLNINENATEVTYNYNCGKDCIVGFTIKVYDQGTVILDSINFPDANFRNYVFKNIDENQDSILSADEMDAVEEIRCPSWGIADLKGIEYFKNLKILYCGYNELTTLDVSKNTALEELYCASNELTSLNVSGNKALKLLNLGHNKLTSLDVSENAALSELHCGDNELTSLDVSENTELTYLDCVYNKLTSLNVGSNTKLTSLYCYDNGLTSLDISNNTELITLSCSYNKLTSLNVGSNTKLEGLYCYDNELTSLDVSKNTALEELYCSENKLTTLDVSKNTELYDMDCSANKLEELRLNSNTKLQYLYCSFNKLTSLDVSNNTELYKLVCEYNSLGSLNLSNNAELAFLYCDKNNLTYLDLSSNTEMCDVSCADSRYVLAEGSTTLELPKDFDTSKVSDMKGGSISGNTLTFGEGATKVTYNYKCSDDYTAAFTIYAANYPKNTVTAEGLYGYYKGVKDGETYTYNYYEGETVNLQIGSRDGYALDGLTLNGITEDNITWYKKDEDMSDRAISFTMPAKAVKVTVNWASYGTGEEGGGSTDDTNKYTVTASGIYNTHYGNEPGATFTLDYAAGEKVSLLIGKRDGYTLKDLTLVGISENDITWAAEGVETDARSIDFTMPANNVTVTVNWTANSTGGDVAINAENFPDENFRTYVSDNIDTDKNGYLDSAEMDAVTQINCSDKGIADLKGIEYFKNLKTLYCNSNQLTSLDVSKNTALTNLGCSYNQLTSLDVSKNTALTNLSCNSNQLTSLDVSKNTALETLNCDSNQLTSLNVSSNAALQYLVCSDNNLIYLNVSSNTWIMCLGNTYVLAEGSTTLELPEDFDTSKVSDMNGGSISGNTLTFDEGSTKVTYNYKCSDRYTAAFAIYTAAHPKCTVTASGMYEMDGITEKTFSGEYFAEDTVSLQIGMRNGYTLESLTLVGISEKDITWNTKEENYTRTISFTMPGNPVTITVNWTANGTGEEGGDDETKYTVTASGFYEGVFGNETGAPFTLSRAAGDTVDMLISMREGYTLKDLTLVGISEKDITWNTKEETTQRMIWFTMPANPVTITVNWTANGTGGGSSSGGGGGTATPKYSVTAPENIENGTVTISPKNASAGSKVTVTVTPDEGFALESLVIKDENGKEIKLTDNGNGKYTFTMPSGKVTVEPSFKVETPEFVEPEKTAGAENPFTDVSADAYYYDAVLWAVEKGITSGTTETTFSPDASCTRAQMLTFMWRAAGSPKATGSNPFTDVSADAYYYDAVLWAVENGITSGISATTFAPDATVTRDQTVTFLYRMAGSPAANGSSFSDVSSDAYYADAVAWAVQQNITSGTGDGQFSPNADCTRAQIVTFLYRYMG